MPARRRNVELEDGIPDSIDDAVINRRHSRQRRQTPDGPVTNCPIAIPTYASACTKGSPSSAYASACSCAGVAKDYTTLPSPVTTKVNSVTLSVATTHITSTATVTVIVPPIPTAFAIQVGSSAGTYADIGTVAKDYFGRSDIAISVVQATAPPAVRFSISGGALSANGINLYVAFTGPDPFTTSYLIVGPPYAGAYRNVFTGFGAYDMAVGAYTLTTLGSGQDIYHGGEVANGFLIEGQGSGNVPTLYAIAV